MFQFPGGLSSLSPFYFYYFQDPSLSLAEQVSRGLQPRSWQATPGWVGSGLHGECIPGAGGWKRRQMAQLSRGRDREPRPKATGTWA